MERTCEYCGVAFCQLNLRTKRMRFCSRRCQENAAYHRNTDYYRARYQQNKEKILQQCAAYREREYVKELRAGYARGYKDKDAARLKIRMEDPQERQAQYSRHRASAKLVRSSPRVCCHCRSLNDVECHHVNENPLDNDISNLAWLCSKCHGAVHSLVHHGLKCQIEHSIRDFQLRLQISSGTIVGSAPLASESLACA